MFCTPPPHPLPNGQSLNKLFDKRIYQSLRSLVITCLIIFFVHVSLYCFVVVVSGVEECNGCRIITDKADAKLVV